MILSHHHGSPLGVAECEDCRNVWPCHLSAWGPPGNWSKCNACGGRVWWTMTDEGDEP